MERRGEKQCTRMISSESHKAVFYWMAEGMSWKNPLDLVWIPAHVQSSALLRFVVSATPEASWQQKQIWGCGLQLCCWICVAGWTNIHGVC